MKYSFSISRLSCLLFLSIALICPKGAQARPAETNASSVVDYAALRSLSCTTGLSVEVTGVRIAGTFSCSDTDPHGAGDDGGIVLKSSNGKWWVRQFPYGPTDPVELDWYGLSDQRDITSLMSALADAFSPKLYVQVPSQTMTLKLDVVDYNAKGIKRFRLLESNVPVTIQALKSTDWLVIKDYQDVVIGSLSTKASRDDYHLTIRGTHGGLGQCNGSQYFVGLIKLSLTSDCNCEAAVRANIDDADYAGLQVIGGNLNVLRLAGVWKNSAGNIRAVDQVILDDLEVTDPYGCAMGWDGTDRYPENNDYEAMGQKHRGLWIQFIEKVAGEVTFKYGGVTAFAADIKAVGTGPEDRFTMNFIDQGYSENGIRIARRGIASQYFKMDPVAIVRQGQPSPLTETTWWMKFVVGPDKYGSSNDGGVQFEATEENSSLHDFFTEYIDAVFVNVPLRSRTNVLGWYKDNVSRYHTLRGDGLNPSMTAAAVHLTDHSKIVSGQWHDVVIEAANCWQGVCYVLPDGNRLENITSTGKVIVKDNATNTVIENVRWLGAAREVMNVQTGSQVTARNLTAPAGSTIGGGGVVDLNGVRISLPYTFTGTEGSGFVNQPPSATGLSTTTPAGQSVSISLQGNDPDGDPISYQILSQPSNGSLTGTAPNLTYSPNAGYAGSDSFTFSVSDGQAESSTATVTITIQESGGVGNLISQQIDLAPGWNMVSLYVRSADMSMESVLASVGNSFVLAKNGNGEVYYPETGINAIGAWQPDEAYQVYAQSNTTFTVMGERISAYAVPISLETGWNLVPYILDQNLPVDVALASIAPDLVLVKNGNGDVYYPEVGIDNIGDLVTGRGYQIYVKRPVNLIYPDGTGPIAYWSFEGTGTTVPDDSENGYDGTLYGATRTSSGHIGNALSFDGIDDYLDLGTMDISGTEMTISAWINADDFDNEQGRIISKANGTDDDDHWWMLSTDRVDGSIRARFRLKTDGTTTKLIAESGDIPAGAWAHVVARYDGAQMQVFVNGVVAGTASKTGVIAVDPSVSVFAGKNPGQDGPYFFDGRIDELRIYDRALTVEEIETLSASSPGV